MQIVNVKRMGTLLPSMQRVYVKGMGTLLSSMQRVIVTQKLAGKVGHSMCILQLTETHPWFAMN